MVLQDGDAAVEAAPAQSLENHDGTGVGVLLQQFTDGGVKRLQLAGALGPGTWLRRLDQIFGHRAPVQVQVTGDLSQRPLLVPVKAVNLVDLFVAQHGWGLILLSGKTGAEARAWLLARSPAAGPNSQTPAAQDFKSRAKLLFARRRRRRFWSLVCCSIRFRAA